VYVVLVTLVAVVIPFFGALPAGQIEWILVRFLCRLLASVFRHLGDE
jgi:hypothetical protein